VSYCLNKIDNNEMSKHPLSLGKNFPLTLDVSDVQQVSEPIKTGSESSKKYDIRLEMHEVMKLLF
jgi:hypothetical protein